MYNFMKYIFSYKGKGKGKVVPVVLTKYHATKTYGGVEV